MLEQFAAGQRGLIMVRVVLISVLLISFSKFAKADAFEAECPEEIKTKQTAVAAPKGWQAHVDTVNARHIFTGLQIFNGHPKDNAPLFAEESVPAAAPVAKGSAAPEPVTDATYKIPAGHEAYVVCEYTSSTVRMIQKIPKGIAACRVKFSETLGHIQKAVCE